LLIVGAVMLQVVMSQRKSIARINQRTVDEWAKMSDEMREFCNRTMKRDVNSGPPQLDMYLDVSLLIFGITEIVAGIVLLIFQSQIAASI